MLNEGAIINLARYLLYSILMNNYLDKSRPYTALISLALIIAWGCKKSPPAPTPAPAVIVHYTAGMGGKRYWRCVDSTNLRYPYNDRDTAIYSLDTFAFTVVNDTVIKRTYPSGFSDSLQYVSTDSVAGTLYFAGTYIAGWTVSLSVWYHYTDNSMVYMSSGSGPGSTYMGQYQRITCRTP
jgi:hypothetical protein